MSSYDTKLAEVSVLPRLGPAENGGVVLNGVKNMLPRELELGLRL